jgi:hypothetical protein
VASIARRIGHGAYEGQVTAAVIMAAAHACTGAIDLIGEARTLQWAGARAAAAGNALLGTLPRQAACAACSALVMAFPADAAVAARAWRARGGGHGCH